MICRHSKGLDQTAQMHSLIRAYAVCMLVKPLFVCSGSRYNTAHKVKWDKCIRTDLRDDRLPVLELPTDRQRLYCIKL